MTERHDYLYIRKGRREVFRTSWSLMKTTESSVTDATPAALALPDLSFAAEVGTPVKCVQPDPAAGRAAPAATSKGKGNQRAPAADLLGGGGALAGANGSSSSSADGQSGQSSAGDKPKPDGQKQKPTPNKKAGGNDAAKQKRPISTGKKGAAAKKPETEFDFKVVDAEATKTLYMLVAGEASLLVSNIKSNSEWAWGRSDDILGKMEKNYSKVADVRNKCGVIGIAYVSGCSVGGLVGRRGQQKVHDTLGRLVSELSPQCDALKVHVDKVASMHTILSQ